MHKEISMVSDIDVPITSFGILLLSTDYLRHSTATLKRYIVKGSTKMQELRNTVNFALAVQTKCCILFVPTCNVLTEVSNFTSHSIEPWP